MEFLFDAGMPRLSHWHTIASTYLMDWVLPEHLGNHGRKEGPNVMEYGRSPAEAGWKGFG